MTNEDLFNDLKQFITATISQQMAHMATKDDLANVATKDDIKELRAELKADIALLDEKVDLVQDAVAESLSRTEATVQNHEHRLRRLEHRAA